MDCDRCQQPLIKIVRYGEQLIGCIDCNCWSGTRSAFVWTSIEDDAITGKAEGKIGRQLSAVSRTDQTAHLFSAAQILDLRAALRKSVVAV